MSEEEAYKELKYLTEENCRSNCEESNMCNDCYISFEQVKAIDFIRNKIEQLQQENKELRAQKMKILSDWEMEVAKIKTEETICRNILNELESWLEEGLKEPNWEKGDLFWGYACLLVLDKLKELKGSDE